MADYDAIVIGSGPNGLCAGIVLARAGLSVLVREGASTIGGSARSAELTLPGFVHDVCSTVHALAVASPMLRTLPLKDHGLELVRPGAPLAHPLDDGTAVGLERSVEKTAQQLGADGAAYRKLMDPLVCHWDALAPDLLAPLRIPNHPIRMARFGTRALRSACALASSFFKTEGARALFAGLAA